jgi:hypothetical protein
VLEEAGCSDVAPTLDALKRTLQRIVGAAARAAAVPAAPVLASAGRGA